MVGTTQAKRHLIEAGRSRAHLSTDQLWLRYFSLGGGAGPVEVDAFLNGALQLEVAEVDRLALAVNERLDELAGALRVPDVRPPREPEPEPEPEAGPLASLTSLLRDTHLRPPENLQDAVDAAARFLGVRATAYVVDHSGSVLLPLGGPGRGPALGVDSTVGGRAFRTLTTVVASDEGPGLWVPIIDGVERLGVLDVVPTDSSDVHDPALRGRCWWFAHYLGHLLGAMDRYGDAIEVVRRQSPRNVGADLVSRLLPPLSAGTAKIVVSGQVEPVGRMGGDVFDYALSAHTAHLGIVDGTGHDLHAGLVAAVAVSACRNARREGRGLFGQVQAVQDAVVAEFGAGAHATGVLAQLDLDTGSLRYICAGHPYPVIMRHGRPVRTLREGRRALLGVDSSEVVVGHERLQPEDVLVLYTDGITEARDLDHRQLGIDGLTDLLAREHAVTTPLPEMVRRVMRTVVRRGDGLKDDATLLLAHWTGEGQAPVDPTVR